MCGCDGAARIFTPAERNVVTSLASYFNAEQFKKWGELVAWPAWETLISDWSLSRTTIWRALQKLEHKGKLEVTHGAFNPSTGHKLGNKYRAFPPPPGFSRNVARFQTPGSSLKLDSTILRLDEF